MAKQQPRQQPSFYTFTVIVIVLLLLAVVVWIMASPPGMLLGL